MKKLKDAASLLVACRTKITSEQKTAVSIVSATKENALREDYKLLMMMRHNKTPFMPSKMVFPGGAVSEADSNPGWSGLFDKLAGPSYQQFLQNLKVAGSSYPVMQANRRAELPAEVIFRICAIRETFEETGLLLVVGEDELKKVNDGKRIKEYVSEGILKRSSSESGKEDGTGKKVLENEEKKKWKRKVLNDADQFMQMCQSLQVLPDVWSLYEWNNWLTPILEKNFIRFDTMFYLCCVQSEQLPVVEADNYESTIIEWREPKDFLKQQPVSFTLTDFSIAPPQCYELTDLDGLPSLESLQLEAHHRTFTQRPRHRLLTVSRLLTDGSIWLLPGDHLYDEWASEEAVFKIEGTSVDAFEDSKEPLYRIIYDRNYPNGRLVKSL